MTGSIRIIGGRWRGRRLAVPELAGLRPTGDRARETLFNWLQFEIAGARCLDVFAGTGALGLEAASRGAARVVLVEREAGLAGNMRTAAEWPGGEVLEVVEGDAMAWLEHADGPFDLVFVDPPFADALHADVIGRLLERELLAPGALVYVEQGADAPVDAKRMPATLEAWREKRVGGVVLGLWRLPG